MSSYILINTNLNILFMLTVHKQCLYSNCKKIIFLSAKANSSTKFSMFKETHWVLNVNLPYGPQLFSSPARENAMSGRHLEFKEGKIDRACHGSIMDAVIRQVGHKHSLEDIKLILDEK